MKIMNYGVGFSTGALAFAAVMSLDLPPWAAILLTVGCAAIGFFVLRALEFLIERWNE